MQNKTLFLNSSHAVLEIVVTRKQRNKYKNQIIRGKLALVDLAGRYCNMHTHCCIYSFSLSPNILVLYMYLLCSERANETNSGGQKLRDGANINRSLLALANCINALGKQQKKGLAYVPYRNRYLKVKLVIMQHGTLSSMYT